MKILHVTPYYYPDVMYGGPIQSVHLLNKYLLKNNVEVDVFTTNNNFHHDNSLNFNDWNLYENIKIKYFKYYGYEHYNFSPRMLYELHKTVKNYDLIHISFVWNFTTLASSLKSIINHKPYVISPRGTLNKEAINIKSTFKKKLNYKLFGKEILKRAQAIHFTSNEEKDNVLDNLDVGNKHFVISNGIDLDEFKNLPIKNSFKNRYPLLKNKRYLLFLGRINNKKGLDLIASAFTELVKLYKDLYLVIVGPDNDNYKFEVERILSKNGAINKTIFTGILEGTRKLEAYVDAEIFLLPSYSENFGMSVVEAMASGVPVVISNKVGIYKELQESNSALVIENKTEDLVRSITNLLDNTEHRISIAEKGQKFVCENYDIDYIANKMIIEYEKIINDFK